MIEYWVVPGGGVQNVLSIKIDQSFQIFLLLKIYTVITRFRLVVSIGKAT